MTEFKSLDMIVKQINHYIDQLNSGKLAATDIDSLLYEVQQLQERLIILRYKAFEATVNLSDEPVVEEVKPVASLETPVVEEPQIETPISFSIGSIPTEPVATESIAAAPVESNKQVSLMDVINEALQNTPDESTDLSTMIQQASGKTVTESVPVATAVVETKIEAVVEVVAEPVVEVVEIPSIIQAAPATQRSIYEEVALGEKLHKQAIGDLSKAIPLHQKFTFINELFGQNADDYHASIEQLNKFEEMEEAMIFIKENLMPLYKWNREDKNVESFIDLVERRFL